jgi:hypothetical protein
MWFFIFAFFKSKVSLIVSCFTRGSCVSVSNSSYSSNSALRCEQFIDITAAPVIAHAIPIIDIGEGIILLKTASRIV